MKLRLLHIVDSNGRRGAEVFASELMSVLNRHLVEQHVVILGSTIEGGVDFPVPTSALPRRGPLLPVLKVDLRILFGLWRLVRRTDPDIIQGHGGDTLKYTAAATIGYPAPVVQRAIGSPPSWVRRGPRRWAYALMLSRSARIIAVAESVQTEIVSLYGIPADRVVMIPSACEPGRVAPRLDRDAIRARLGIPVNAPVVISLGALTWEKDPLEHVEVTACLIHNEPECRHLVVGDGPLRAEVEARIRDLAIGDRVLMLGSREDVGDLLAASDVMLLASRIEGMPASVIEAGFAGVPVVAFSVAGVSEVVVDGVTGYLVPPGDRKGLVSGISRLIGDRTLRQTMSESARRWISARYDIGAIGPKYLEQYELLLERQRNDSTIRKGDRSGGRAGS